MDKKIIKFDDTKVEKHKFHQHKSPFSIDKIDIDRLVMSLLVKRILNVYWL